MADLPPKLFFRIGEVAGLVGVEPHVLRYWEREFRSIRPTKSAKGQRVYSRKDVENLLRVRDLLYRDGFTIAGAKKKLQRGPEDEVTAQVAPELGEASASLVETFNETEEDPEPSVELEPQSIVNRTPASVEAPLREQLLALRDEVEGFLSELSTGSIRPRPASSSTQPSSGTKRVGERT
jgi:DNA-binding transcriptional MerR regulator